MEAGNIHLTIGEVLRASAKDNPDRMAVIDVDVRLE